MHHNVFLFIEQLIKTTMKLQSTNKIFICKHVYDEKYDNDDDCALAHTLTYLYRAPRKHKSACETFIFSNPCMICPHIEDYMSKFMLNNDNIPPVLYIDGRDNITTERPSNPANYPNYPLITQVKKNDDWIDDPLSAVFVISHINMTKDTIAKNSKQFIDSIIKAYQNGYDKKLNEADVYAWNPKIIDGPIQKMTILTAQYFEYDIEDFCCTKVYGVIPNCMFEFGYVAKKALNHT